ncbi:ATP-dependent DNA helicase PIF1-like [Haemaphysalis longicornis]
MVASEFGNLPREVLLVVGKPYMITSNIDVVDGLVNGAIVHEAKRSGYDVKSVTWIPIETQSLTLTIDRKAGIACKRTQFPVVQASAITVHKSQGGTDASFVYEYARTHPQKLVYLALSRCTDLKGLYLTNVDGDLVFCFCSRAWT